MIGRSQFHRTLGDSEQGDWTALDSITLRTTYYLIRAELYGTDFPLFFGIHDIFRCLFDTIRR